MAKMTKKEFEGKGYLFAAYTEEPFNFIGFESIPMTDMKTGKMITVLHYTFGEYEEGSDWKTVNYPIFTHEDCEEAILRTTIHNKFFWCDEDNDYEEHEISKNELMDKVYNYFNELDSEYCYSL